MTRLDWVVLLGLLVLAAALRLPNLETRSTWGPEQAAIMVGLRDMVAHGAIPLLGLPTGEGAFHHGALFFYIMAPGAALSAGADPTTAVAEMAIAGMAAVAVTWWMARSMGGPLAGLAAGVLAAVSAAAITCSTVIDNPNLMPLFSAVAIGGAWSAWSTRRESRWLVAAAGQSVVQQLQILGTLALPSYIVLFALDVRRRRGEERRRLLRVGVVAIAILAAGYLPLAVHEFTTGFAETRAALGATPGAHATSLLSSLTVIPARIASYSLSLPDRIDRLAAALVIGAFLIFAFASAWFIARSRSRERTAAVWLGSLWAAGAALLAIVFMIKGNYLPFFPDWYVTYLAPAVYGLVGLGAAVLWRVGSLGRLTAVLVVTAVATWNLAYQLPPPVAYDGGWPAAREAGAHVTDIAQGRPVEFIDASRAPVDYYRYPFEMAGGHVAIARGEESALVAVSCFDAWRAATGVTLSCGGPAETAALSQDLPGRRLRLVERFSPAYGRSLSVFAPVEP
ncbi:MAG: hypothetical protein ACYC65_06480 [Candidatus Limnocylindrales bacterium]